MRGRRKESRREGVEWPKITLINKSNNCNLNLIELFDICQHFAGANCCNNVARVPQDAYRTSGSLYEYMCVCVCAHSWLHISVIQWNIVDSITKQRERETRTHIPSEPQQREAVEGEGTGEPREALTSTDNYDKHFFQPGGPNEACNVRRRSKLATFCRSSNSNN